jgi:hypothetical protein
MATGGIVPRFAEGDLVQPMYASAQDALTKTQLLEADAARKVQERLSPEELALETRQSERLAGLGAKQRKAERMNEALAFLKFGSTPGGLAAGAMAGGEKYMMGQADIDKTYEEIKKKRKDIIKLISVASNNEENLNEIRKAQTQLKNELYENSDLAFKDKNYVYTLSEREIAKLSFGLGLPCFAFKSFNDFLDENLVKGEPIIGNLDFDTVLEQIKLKDSFCEITGSPSSYITGIFFKESPDHSIIENLSNLGFTFVRTPSRFLPINWPNIPGLF